MRDVSKISGRDYTWDVETYPNIFTFRATHVATGKKYCYEVSDRKDERATLFQFLSHLRVHNQRMVGFNNLWFDWEVVQWFMDRPHATVEQIYAKAMERIKGGGYPMWASDRYIEQIDLLKIHHFDNMAKATSLKALEIAMKMRSVQDLPFPVGTYLNDWQKDMLLAYNDHDVDATTDFYFESYEMIEFREELTEKYQKDFMNFADTKIGAQIFIEELEKAGIDCYERIDGKREPRQTIRPTIDLNECVFPYVRFEHPAFKMIENYLRSQVIRQTKGVFSNIICTQEMVQYMDAEKVKVWLKGAKKPRRLCHLAPDTDFTGAKYVAVSLHCRINGLNYEFGTGGLHASLHRTIVRSNATHVIKDWDVASYYPNLAIKNRVYPAHLSEKFCDIYNFMYHERLRVGKKTKMGGAYKLALNGTYGNSNNEHSPFYDPMYTMKITINGQLSLCMLVEQLIKVPGLEMIQCNTDGITFRCPRIYNDHCDALFKWWEQLTQLELEEAIYKNFYIRDVNSYIAEYEDGKLKRKGAYEYKREWHKDHSSLVVQKAVEAQMVYGDSIVAFIMRHRLMWDFMCRGKVNRDSTLHLVKPDGTEQQLSNTIRFYVAKEGGSLIKRTMPKGTPGTWKRKNGVADYVFELVMNELRTCPTEGRRFDLTGIPHDERIHTKNKSQWPLVSETGIASGQLVAECSNADDFDWNNINYDWYIAEAYKLLIM